MLTQSEPETFEVLASPTALLNHQSQVSLESGDFPDGCLAGYGTSVLGRDFTHLSGNQFATICAGAWKQPESIVVAPQEPVFQFGDLGGAHGVAQEEVLLEYECDDFRLAPPCFTQEISAPSGVVYETEFTSDGDSWSLSRCFVRCEDGSVRTIWPEHLEQPKERSPSI